MINQEKTPILDAIREWNHKNAAFYTPGHKRGKGISQELRSLFGESVFKADLTELEGLDSLHCPEGVIKEAQELAADIFGASKTWFLVNGSTCGIEAAILATCNHGDKIILPRNVHYSAVSGLILSGAIPIFIHPEYDSVLDIAHSITTDAVEDALAKHPDAKAVMIVYPTYYGVCGDVKAIAEICHRYNIPLLVDEAHGAHFIFHPDFPIPSLKANADLVIQSTHKTLGAMTQASMLHLQGNLIDIDRVGKALQLVQSTSPSYILLASLDAARQQMALSGKGLMTQTLQLAEDARNRITKLPLISLLSEGLLSKNLSGSLDKTRLTITVSQLGITGFEAEEILDNQLEVTPEFASMHHITFIISLGNTQQDIDDLVTAIATLVKIRLAKIHPSTTKPQQKSSQSLWENFFSIENPLQMSPREAFFATTKSLPLRETTGYICAEIVCPYPPGIPVLMPGEIITEGAIEYLLEIHSMGSFITASTDINNATFKIVV
jgi:arginine decarboxylase